MRNIKLLTSFLFLFVAQSQAMGAEPQCHDSLRSSFDAAAVIRVDSGVLFDKTTGLMWMRCSLGQQWLQGDCVGTPTVFDWPAALQQTAAIEFAGYSDWRLPNKNELESIVERRCYEPAINLAIFPKASATPYWTNSANNFNDAFAWAINFSNGEHITSRRTNEWPVRLVRVPN